MKKKNHSLENTIVKNLGGLYIIGTEKNDSRRIDNQLRGRCGRQGDPGLSRFFLSIDDKLLRLFGNPKFENILKDQFLDDLPLESKLVTKVLDSAQKQLEERNYDLRKNLFEYDEILNKQRNVIYYERRKILESESIRSKILVYGEQLIVETLKQIKNNSYVFLLIEDLLNTELFYTSYTISDYNVSELKLALYQEFWLSYELKILEFEVQYRGLIREFGRILILYYMDLVWKEHLQKMSLLRDAVGWRRYGQRNPLFEYKEEAYQLFKYRNLITRRIVIYELLYSSIL